MAIAAVWDPSGYSYTLTSGLSGDVRWFRNATWADGRTAYSVDLGSGNPIVDPLVPLDGATVFYYASSPGGEESLSVTPPMPAKPVLTVPSDTGAAGVLVTVRSQRETAWTGRTKVFNVIGRLAPLVDPERPIERRGDLVLDVPHTGSGFPSSALRGVREMLYTGMPLLLRTVCNERVETLPFIAESWVEVPYGEPNAHGPDRLITISYRVVHPVYGDDVVISQRIWNLVPLEFATWDDVPAGESSWGDLAYGAVAP